MDPNEISLERPGEWFVLHTRARHEKGLSDDLKAREIAHFLPLVTKVRYWGNRKAVVEEPLFPGYVFLRGSNDDAYIADRTRHVAQIIQVPDQRRLSWELQNLAQALQHKVPLDPFPYLKKGVRVAITSGPMRGLQGVVESRQRADKIILAVDMLGQAVSMELHGALVELVE